MRRLAEHPDFARCKTEAERVYLLEKLLGDEAPAQAYLKKEIAREASAIYKLDVAPRR